MKHHFISPLIAIVIFAGTAYADTAAKQVNIESKIVDVNQKNMRDLGVSYLFYQNLDGRDGKAEVAFAVTPLPENKTKIEVTTIAYGHGADYRRWVPQNPQLTLTVKPEVGADGNVTMNLLPEKTEKIYVTKPSAAAPVAPILFAIMGSQYEGPGAEAASQPGKVCPVTGQPISGDEHKRSDTAQAIDKAGMAAGMGLLTSQAKGQLEGQKAVFISESPVAGLLFKTEARNKDKNQTLIFVTPTLIKVEDR